MHRFGANEVFPLLVRCMTDTLPELHVMPSVLRDMYSYQVKHTVTHLMM